MKITTKLATILAIATTTQATLAQRNIPADAKETCTISSSDFAKWASAGQLTNGKLNPQGWVNPADSLNFPSDNTKCDFYKWSWQMFLWLNSPDNTGGGWVFDSDQFYDVSPSVDSTRTLLPNTSISNFSLRSHKPEVIGETGQAGGSGVLISQAHGSKESSLVYYGIHVNDVYAEFLAGQKSGNLTPAATTFPDSPADLAAVIKYADKNFPDNKALTLELKTSWVKSDSLQDPSRYIQISATVPKYIPSANKKTWVLQEKSETTNLALVGMHVVGTLNGHPEFCWATFEHIDNAPDAPYYYTKQDGTQALKAYDSSGDWLFMETNGSQNGANNEVATVNSNGDIVAKGNSTIGPSNTVRNNPWGNAGNSTASAPDNTDVISINNSVRSFLDNSDARKNYVLGGALWTQNGGIPGVNTSATQIGSLLLANATMETYQQSHNCFYCHQGPSFNAFSLSHIYSEITPLNATENEEKKKK